MPETFAQYLEKWLKQSTSQGLNNPLVKMPVKRFRLLLDAELQAIANGGTIAIGTLSDPVARNLFRNFQMRIRERGEHCAFICYGSVELLMAGTSGQRRVALLPVCLKRASLSTAGEHIRVTVSEEDDWQFNPVLNAHLKGFGIQLPEDIWNNPSDATNWVRVQLGNRAQQVTTDSYVGLFSSQQMVVQARLGEPVLRKALASNPVVKAKIEGGKVESVELNEITDEGLEDLGFVLPSDDSQLRVVQLSDRGFCLQVEGPPGTGKSQTIANIISNALLRGRNALLVCDKRAAITQVEERLANCGLQPALLNLHDEDLDKRALLSQATAKFPSVQRPHAYPLDELRESRNVLNNRVKFGREIAHPSLQVTKRDALGGMIQLRKELKDISNVQIANWQALSKERLSKLLGSIKEWPDLAPIITDCINVWNEVKVEAFDDNPNAPNEIEQSIEQARQQLQSLDTLREWIATVGVECNINSDNDVEQVLELTQNVLAKPICHPKLIGNSALTVSELDHLRLQWQRREELLAINHPVSLSQLSPEEVKNEANELLAAENSKSWRDLSNRIVLYDEHYERLHLAQSRYSRLCDQIGLVYSPLLKVRRAQLQALLSLGGLRSSIPREWWNSHTTPVFTVAEWKAHFQACVNSVREAPLPLHFLALEKIAKTHWKYVEAKAEHGFGILNYCLHFVTHRKCKYALRRAFPSIPTRGFKQWQEATFHAVSALALVESLRTASESHPVLTRLSSAYLAVAHEDGTDAATYVIGDDMKSLEKSAALVEQIRQRNDLFAIDNVHWQTFWEFPNLNLLTEMESLLESFDDLIFPAEAEDHFERGLETCKRARHRIEEFLAESETEAGDRSLSVLDAFSAQAAFKDCEQQLESLEKYLHLSANDGQSPDWDWLSQVIEWRDTFETLRGKQRLDIDSSLWKKIKDSLFVHKSSLQATYSRLHGFFDYAFENSSNYDSFTTLLDQVLQELQRRHLWIEKKRWQNKISLFPELKGLWQKLLDGSTGAQHAERLFCFNLLRMCNPIARPHGPEFKQTLNSFKDQDDKLSAWVVDKLKASLAESMRKAALAAAVSESELRRLAGLRRIRGTVRELVNAHIDYLINAKPCWMMSPTSLANLIDSQVFDDWAIPFDLVIFDEASQIRVLDGLLSMAFGKQVIIVGDRKQLPPTDFFAAFSQPDNEGEPEDFGVSESLLEEFGGVFEDDKTQVMLMSHYRSETPDLIRFSNDWFYDRKLELYPPAHITGIGRRLHYVPNAIYSEIAGRRNNPLEAKEVIKLIQLHVDECPDKSLGVVTMNIPQMELIDSELQMCTSEKVREFCADESRFFLRNLETVQGDEMDRIILSLTYGKSAAGQFNASVLGPLTRSGGERRLNVAITRSRSGLIVVSSLKAIDLEGSSAQSDGFKCLKAFLTDLESSESSRTFGVSNSRFERRDDGVSNVVYCDSPFEEQVVEFLENEGYELECQYGAGKFRLDIVVKEKGKNLLAIECDGAAYHSSLVARTRDRARQRLLERQFGWRVHRVWSTNWWYFEQQEKEAIIQAINAARTR
jgi:REase_MTES_1575/AAA domain